MNYKINIARDYSEYTILDEQNNNMDITINPLERSLFTNDILDEHMQLIDSPIKREIIPAVLLLDKSLFTKKHKTYYKCIPNHKNYPIFMVGKKQTNQFHKYIENNYVLIKYKAWDGKHPEATLIETIGTVSSIEYYTIYLMYCKQLVFKLVKWKPISPISCKISEDRTNREIITIDPMGSKDLDDALGIEQVDNTIIISTYIANVSLLLYYLDVWNIKNDQVSTIYLHEKNIPMLPRQFSENIASLLEQTERYALATDFTMRDNKIINVRFIPCKIKVFKNYTYEESSLLENSAYKKIVEHYPGNNSHDIVELLMKNTNYYAAKELYKHKRGVYRTTIEKYKSSYVNYAESNLAHEDLNLDMYMHVTSPIRRIVDILNQMQLQRDIILLTEEANEFYDYWSNRLDYINEQTSAIRKVQNKSILMHALQDSKDRIYDAEIIEVGENKYLVFIKELNLVHTLKEDKRMNMKDRILVKIYVFWREHTQKIKLKRILGS